MAQGYCKHCNDIDPEAAKGITEKCDSPDCEFKTVNTMTQEPDQEPIEFKLLQEAQQEIDSLKESNRMLQMTVDMYTEMKVPEYRVEIDSLKAELAKHQAEQPKKFADAAIPLMMNLKEENDKLKAELSKHQWIPVSERLPDEKDGDDRGFVEVWAKAGCAITVNLMYVKRYAHWRRIIKP
jgi:hypothetical protein